MPRRVVVVALLLALSACSTSSEAQPGSLPPVTPLASPAASAAPTGTPAPSGPASPSPTASLAPVVKPRAADRPDRAGAEAFTRYWYALLNEAYLTLDGTRLAKSSAPNCGTCQNFLADIAAAAKERDRYVGGGFILRDVVAAPPEPKATSVLVDYDMPALRVYDATGKQLAAFPDRRVTVEVTLTYTQGWRASSIAETQ